MSRKIFIKNCTHKEEEECDDCGESACMWLRGGKCSLPFNLKNAYHHLR